MSARVQAATPVEAMPIGSACTRWRTDCNGVPQGHRYQEAPSGFFGTTLASYLTLLGCDSVIVIGTTTSGCVRATVVDAFSLNYRVTLAEEGCFDRSEASHAVSQCHMHAKYGPCCLHGGNPPKLR
jgi:hypothetical protein